MKRIGRIGLQIGLVLALVLSGMLGLMTPVAQAQPAGIGALFSTYWIYSPPEDAFNNGDSAVTGRKNWHANIGGGEPVPGLTLTLDSTLTFDHLQQQNLTTMGPPTYVWSLGDIPLGPGSGAYVGFAGSPNPFPVTFTPGYNCSRSADVTEFSEPGTQTLTITLTPLERTEGFEVLIHADENDQVNPVITSPTSGEGINLLRDGHWLHISPTGLELNTTWTITVTIQVTPKVPRVEFMPFVSVGWDETVTSGTVSGSSFSYPAGDPADEVGTWTSSATGSYEWSWTETLRQRVSWHPYSRDLSNYIDLRFDTRWTYDPLEDTFINGEVTGSKSWFAEMRNKPGGTGAPVTALALNLDSTLAFDGVYPDPVAPGPPYDWFFGDAPEGFYTHAFVRFESSPNPFPVTFTPGYDASRSVDKTVFTAPDTQTLTITVTPRQEGMTGFAADVIVREDDKVIPIITSPTTDETQGIWLSLDGRRLLISRKDAVVGIEYTYTVTIEVTPKVPLIEFMPLVKVRSLVEFLTTGTATGSSVSYNMPGVGTWTWNADGNYTWNWRELISKAVIFQRYSNTTPEGTNVEVEVNGDTITFGEVTTGGDTTVTPSPDGPPVPTWFRLGNPPTYFDFTTTADYTGTVTVSIDYSGIQFGNESKLKLKQWNGTDWVDITTSVDTLNDIIYGETSSLSIFVVVEPNIPPVAQASADYYLEPVGVEFTFNGSTSYDPDGTIESYEWNFGDKSDVGIGSTVTHDYAAPGIYNVVLTVIDDTGAQSTDTVMAVVYDPTAGFATGGGWFIPGGSTSDIGDMLPGLDNTSPANFGFVVKYKQGATTPDGQLEFQYHQGNFDLHSSGMDWLVVTNNNWAKFQGLATIKDMEGLFPFRVDAWDSEHGGSGQPDRFIIKIYSPGTDPDLADPIYKTSGDLQGGNVIIHSK